MVNKSLDGALVVWQFNHFAWLHADDMTATEHQDDAYIPELHPFQLANKLVQLTGRLHVQVF